MLTANRPQMAARAVRCFRAQTYENKDLLIWNTGNQNDFDDHDDELMMHCWCREDRGNSIAALRNTANSLVGHGVWCCGDILINWDDDDWSHPDRIAEQVALLQASGADVVGYREMLFWRDTEIHEGRGYPSEAWLYSNDNPRYALGTSLCYWRKTWEQKPFPENRAAGADDLYWLQGLKVATDPSFLPKEGWPLCWHWGGAATRSPQEALATGGWATRKPQGLVFAVRADRMTEPEPRMIATIHGANTCGKIEPAAKEWKRVPEWDERVRTILEGA
jgi:hypothetical protein